MLDIVYLLGVVFLFVLVGLVATAVERWGLRARSAARAGAPETRA